MAACSVHASVLDGHPQGMQDSRSIDVETRSRVRGGTWQGMAQRAVVWRGPWALSCRACAGTGSCSRCREPSGSWASSHCLPARACTQRSQTPAALTCTMHWWVKFTLDMHPAVRTALGASCCQQAHLVALALCLQQPAQLRDVSTKFVDGLLQSTAGSSQQHTPADEVRGDGQAENS